jgi:hypothetical protein
MHIARGVEVARFAKLLYSARVVAEFRIVEAEFHVARKGNRASLPDLPLDFLA